jgi:hypothetical protein
MKEATTITAVWREDWSALILILVLLAVIVCAFAFVFRIVIPRLRAGNRTGKSSGRH